MKGIKKINIILIACCFLAACTKEKRTFTAANSFVFGASYSLCMDDCATFFKIQDQQLYPDNTNSYVNPLIFSGTPMSHDQYLLAKQLQDSLPAYLTSHTDTSYGCPDCHDQGMVHIQQTVNGVRRSWIIDAEVSAIPVEIRHYIEQVKAIILQL